MSETEPLLQSSGPKTPEKEDDDDALFDYLMAQINNNGYFQKRFAILFNFLLTIIVAMPDFNLVLALSIPDHWCHVPGRNESIPLPEWKNDTIPQKFDPATHKMVYSSCTMINTSGIEVKCQFGYEYDRSWFQETAVSEEDWVCDRDIFVTHTFGIQIIGEIIGTFILGQFGDRIGRKWVFYTALILMVVGRLGTPYSAHYFWLFAATVFVGSGAPSLLTEPIQMINMEIISPEGRSTVAILSSIGGTIGLCLLALIGWLVNDWRNFILATTLPCLIFFFTFRLLIESPRWLASRGRIQEAEKVLKNIADVNGTKPPDDTSAILSRIGGKFQETYGVASLFSSRRLAKHSIILSASRTITFITYNVILLNITNMAGNPFLNFFIQSLADLPGSICGHFFSNTVGRRWTHTGAFIMAIIFSILLLVTYHLDLPWLVTILVFATKISITIASYIYGLQCVEIYPTCIRQSGTTISTAIATLLGICSPYIVYSGISLDPRLPYLIVLGMFFFGAVSTSFLPETKNQKLPESLDEANRYGETQKYWSI